MSEAHPSSADDPVRKRARNHQREMVIAALEFAFQDGQITFIELQERTKSTYQCTYADELDALVRDLSLPAQFAPLQPGHSAPPQAPAPPDTAHAALAPRFATPPPAPAAGSFSTQSPVKQSMAFFSQIDRRGAWRVAQQHNVVAMFSNATIDFTQAELTAPRTVVELLVVAGDVEITVPAHYRVEVDLIPFLGEVAWNRPKTKWGFKGRAKGPIAPTPPPNYSPDPPPILVINGLLSLGQLHIRQV